MGIFSRFENKAEDVIEGSGARGRGGIEPVKLAKRACKEMEHEKMIGVGHEYAPTLYNILVSPEDDAAMNGYYASLAGEIETYLTGQGGQRGLVFDCQPLVRFIVDDGLRRGKFDVIAESVSPAIISELRHEEMVRYGMEFDYDSFNRSQGNRQASGNRQQAPQQDFEDIDFGTSAPRQANDEDVISVDFEDQGGNVSDATGNEAFAEEIVEDGPAPDVSDAQIPQEQAPAQAAQPQPAAAPTPQAVEDQRTVILNDEPIQPVRTVLYDLKTQRVYDLRDDRSIVGRDMRCDVVLPDPSVSRRHAEVLHNDAGWLIRDTGSTNGMVVNGVATTQSRIYDGDIIELGTTQLEFQEG